MFYYSFTEAAGRAHVLLVKVYMFYHMFTAFTRYLLLVLVKVHMYYYIFTAFTSKHLHVLEQMELGQGPAPGWNSGDRSGQYGSLAAATRTDSERHCIDALI